MRRRYTVSVDADAAAVSGRTLGSAFQFAFTTPTVRLTSARWARRTDRFDQPVTLALMFNQRVRAADVVAHLTVRYQPHTARNAVVHGAGAGAPDRVRP